jgi:hypothetical protein
LPTSHWPWAVCRAAHRHGPSAGLLDRRPVSPLSTSRARSGTGWAGRPRVDRCQRRDVDGVGAGAQGPAFALPTGQAPACRTASGTLLRRSRWHPAGRSQSACLQHPAGLLDVGGRPLLSGLRASQVGPAAWSGWDPRRAVPDAPDTLPASGLITQPVARTPSAGGQLSAAGPAPANRPGSRGTRRPGGLRCRTDPCHVTPRCRSCTRGEVAVKRVPAVRAHYSA